MKNKNQIRRKMVLNCCSALAVTLCTTPQIAHSQSAVATWGQLQSTAQQGDNAEDYQVTPSPNGNVMSILLGKKGVDLQGSSDALHATKTLSIRVPVTPAPGRRLVGFRTSLRGFLFKSRHTHVTMVTQLNGTSKVNSWKSPVEINGSDFRREFYSPVSSSFRSSAGNHLAYTAVITLNVERANPQATGVLQIDSLDVTPVFAR